MNIMKQIIYKLYCFLIFKLQELSIKTQQTQTQPVKAIAKQ